MGECVKLMGTFYLICHWQFVNSTSKLVRQISTVNFPNSRALLVSPQKMPSTCPAPPPRPNYTFQRNILFLMKATFRRKNSRPTLFSVKILYFFLPTELLWPITSSICTAVVALSRCANFPCRTGFIAIIILQKTELVDYFFCEKLLSYEKVFFFEKCFWGEEGEQGRWTACSGGRPSLPVKSES